MRSFTWHGITFRAGMHLWSNPAIRDTPAAIPVILTEPTFFDLILLAEKYGVAALGPVKDQLPADGEMSALQHQRTADTLATIRLVYGNGPSQLSAG
ncbi:hypothetical protein [Paraburkholderia sp.]|jgi:hypothetical protein|uniref:hypothetical protein n=1 Tax=Paraburkholderia sp. TaxID=1926495 RepID=UPI003C7DA703